MPLSCQRCGRELQILRKPTRRLAGTPYWWRGFVSLFTGALRLCASCGAVHTPDGKLLAAGLVETDQEVVLRRYRDDMANLRDSFAAVVVAADIMVAWMLIGPQSFGIGAPLLAGAIGLAALVPFAKLAKRARAASRELKDLRTARLRGDLPSVPQHLPPGETGRY